MNNQTKPTQNSTTSQEPTHLEAPLNEEVSAVDDQKIVTVPLKKPTKWTIARYIVLGAFLLTLIFPFVWFFILPASLVFWLVILGVGFSAKDKEEGKAIKHTALLVFITIILVGFGTCVTNLLLWG